MPIRAEKHITRAIRVPLSPEAAAARRPPPPWVLLQADERPVAYPVKARLTRVARVPSPTCQTDGETR